jgi:hypothetical protein
MEKIVWRERNGQQLMGAILADVLSLEFLDVLRNFVKIAPKLLHQEMQIYAPTRPVEHSVTHLMDFFKWFDIANQMDHVATILNQFAQS